jgi:hypothetical protein
MCKTVILTFDYELFFGSNSGSIQNCILDPTEKILTVFAKHNIKGTFFVDVLYYMRLLESETTLQEALMLKEQLKAIVAQGSRIELHLHPHWLDAKYIKGEWIFPSYKRYSLQALSHLEIARLFEEGTKVLEDIAREVISDYKIIAFRAGGFCIQPFEHLKPAFEANNICVDSSVAPGFFEDGKVRKYDFRNSPNLSYYSFIDDPTKIQIEGRICEAPIATYKISFLSKLWNRFSYISRKPLSTQINEGVGIPMIKPWWTKFLTDTRMITLDGNIVPGQVLRQIAACNRAIVTVISHPKSLTISSFEAISQMKYKGYLFEDFVHILKLFRTH